MSGVGASLYYGGWDPQMNMIDPLINVLVFFNGAAPSIEALVKSVQKNWWYNYRFKSCMDAGQWVCSTDQMDVAYHFKEKEMSDEASIDAYMQTVMMDSPDTQHPPWRFTVFRVQKGRSAMWFQTHHSVGDGIGMLFATCPMLECKEGHPLTKIPLPALLKPPSLRGEPSGPRTPKKCCGGCSVGSFMRGVAAPLVARHDSEMAINPPLAQRSPFLIFNRRRVYTRFPDVLMTMVSDARKRFECSVNDVLMAALTGALRRYGAEVKGDEKLKRDNEKLECKSLVMLALPRKVDENDMCSALCNKILFTSCKLPIDSADMADRVARTVNACNDLKSASYIMGLASCTDFLSKCAPKSMLRKAASEYFSKHTLLVSNMPSTTVPVGFPETGGEQVSEIQMVFPNIVTQVSIVTYNGKVCANLVADPDLFPSPEVLGQFWAEELAMLAGARR